MILFRRNNKYYYIKFKTDAGKEIRFSTKKKFKHEALRVLSELKSNPKKMKKKKKGISFKKCKKLYLDESKHAHSYRYFDVLNRSLRLFETHVGNLELKKIDRIMVTTFINGFLEENRIYPANQHFRNLRTFFNWTVVNQFVKESPVKGLKAPKIPERKPKWISEEELYSILDFIEKPLLSDIYKVLFYTGMRAGELVSLTWSNVHLGSKIIYVSNSNGFRTKTGKERLIPMNDKVLQIIESQVKSRLTDYIFYKNHVKINVDYISKNFKEALKQTNLDKDIHLHSLRHSFASNLVKKGANIYHISKLLGHSKVSTTEIYAHVNNAELVDVVNLI